MAKKKEEKKQQDDQQDIQSRQLLMEAEEALQRERMENLWKRYGALIIGCCLLIIIGTGVNVFWQSKTNAQNMARTDKIFAFLKDPEKDTRAERLLENDISINNPNEWLTYFYAANDLLEQKKHDEALELYQTLRTPENRLYGRDLRWLADTMALRILMDKEGENAADVRSRFEKLGARDGNPWSAVAYYDAAIIAGQLQGDYDGALILLDKAQQSKHGNAPLSSLIRELTNFYQIQANLNQDQTDKAQQKDKE